MDLNLIRDLEQRLKTHVIGQDEAVDAVSKVLRRARTGVRNPTRPLASFLFAGPAAAGKSKFADALANEFHQSMPYSLIRFDMGDYDNKHFVSQLTESIHGSPRSIVLLYRVENSNRGVGSTLLRIIDEGTLTDWKGQRGDFRNAVIVMTSDYPQPALYQTHPAGEVRNKMSSYLSGIFGTKISSRVDEIVVFKAVTREHVEQMVEDMVRGLTGRIKSWKHIEVGVTNAMKNKVVEQGYDPISCGAKPLKSAFARLVEDPLADAVLESRIIRGKSYTLDYRHTSGPFLDISRGDSQP